MSAVNPDFSGLLFGTSNSEKAREYSDIFGYAISTKHLDFPEPTISQAMWKLMADGKYQEVAELVALEKAIIGYELNQEKLIVVEAALVFCRGLDGFPGPFIGDLDSPVAREVLSRRANSARFGEADSSAVAMVTLSVYSPVIGAQYRHGAVEGEICSSPQGEFGFGWDSTFRLKNSSIKATFAQMLRQEKNLLSMRRESATAVRANPFRLEN